MRNILQYPVTADEVRQTIQHEIDRLNGFGDPSKIIVGGISGLVWNALLKTLDVQIDKDLTVMDIVVEEANPF